jgi:S-DNA-T family DNA segregation ATPase FtsK/SpoIIIE
MFTFGKASFIFPLLTFLWAIGRLTRRTIKKFSLKFLGAAVLTISISSFLSMISSGDSVVRFSNGGITGLGFSYILQKYFGMVGSYVIITSLAVLSLVLATEFLIFPLVYAAVKGIIAFSVNLKKDLAEKRIAIGVTKPKSAKPALRAFVRAALQKEAAKGPVKKPREDEGIPIFTPAKKPQQPPSRESEAPKRVEPKPEEGRYNLPPLSLLDSPPPIEQRKLVDDLQTSGKMLEETFSDFGLEVKVVRIEQGPVITRYELEPAPGIKLSRIASLGDNVALAMKATSVRIVAPIPGKGTIGVEVPNSKSSLVYLKEVLESSEFRRADSKLTMALGKDIAGQAVCANLADMPHLLIAGTTGSGKTVCVNSLIASMLFNATPEEVRFVMVDPKMVELSIYNDIPHLLCPVVTDHKKVSAALNWIVGEMEARYKLFAETGSRNIDIFNKKARSLGDKDTLPYIVVIIDELADLMVVAAQDIENAITRLAQLSRAVGIHIVLATQRPSVDVITGVIKANFPARISFKVATKVDSRTVLDMNGADKLLGKGDMLFIEPGAPKPVRAQGCLVSDAEIERIVKYIKEQRPVSYSEEILKAGEKARFKTFEKDDIYEEAVKVVLQTKQASVSMLQRRLGVGYTRAARLIDMMEDEGIVGPYAGSKPRDILVDEYKKEEEVV